MTSNTHSKDYWYDIFIIKLTALELIRISSPRNVKVAQKISDHKSYNVYEFIDH